MHPDIILYLLFESIRNHWGEGIEERGEAIKDILPYTTFREKNELHEHISLMLTSLEENEEFDGRWWARDGKFCYYTFYKYFITLTNLSSSPLLKWGRSNDDTPRLESNPRKISCAYEETIMLYNEWKKS